MQILTLDNETFPLKQIPDELEEEVRLKAMSTSPSPMPRNNGYTPFGSGEMKF